MRVTANVNARKEQARKMADSVDRATADDVAKTDEIELENPASPTIEVCISVLF